MDRPRPLIRGLRIAVSAVCGVLCVLLVVFWVRSKWTVDTFGFAYSPRLFLVSSYSGELTFANIYEGRPRGTPPWYEDGKQLPTTLGFAWRVAGFAPDPYSYFVLLPHWCAVAVFALAFVLPRISWSQRFSLRTLLIATTLIAVVLGLVVWSMS
jgi:hypothetical protein